MKLLRDNVSNLKLKRNIWRNKLVTKLITSNVKISEIKKHVEGC